MGIEIEIPKEFEEHFMQDKFKDSFERIMADIEHSLENGDCLCAGRYEYETIEMLQKAFENSKPAYSVDKVVEELEKQAENTVLDFISGGYVAIDKAIEIVKQGGVGTEKETIRDKAIKWNNNSSKRVPYEFIDYVEGKREIDVSVLRKEDKDCR